MGLSFLCGFPSVTTLLSPVNSLLIHCIISGNSVKWFVYLILNSWIKCLRKVSVFLYDNFPGQTASNNKHLFYSRSPNKMMSCQNCGCEKRFLRKGSEWNLGFGCLVCNMHQNLKPYAVLLCLPCLGPIQ